MSPSSPLSPWGRGVGGEGRCLHPSPPTPLPSGERGATLTGGRRHQLAALGFLLDRSWQVGVLRQVRAGRVGHVLGPDVETAMPGLRDSPGAPDALALVVALVEYVVLVGVVLGPATLAVLHAVTAAHGVPPDPVTALPGEDAPHKGDVQFGLEPSRGRVLLNPESHPAPTWEARIGFKLASVLTHDGSSAEASGGR